MAEATEVAEFDLGAAIDEIAAGRETGGEDTGKQKPADVPGEAPAAGEAVAAEVPLAGAAEAGKDAKPAEEGAAVPAPAAGLPVPDTWTAGAKAKWATLPPDIQAEVVKREGDFASGIKQYKDYASVGERFAGVAAPFIPSYQKAGLDPWQTIPAILRAHAVMAWGQPADKIQMFKVLAQDAGIDLGKIAEEGTAAADSTVAKLQAKVNELESGVTRVAQDVRSSQVAGLEKMVEAFAADPAHPHFNDVAAEMKRLIDGGVCADLKSAYDAAIWTNPITRAKESDRLAGLARTKADAEAAKKVEAAKKATSARVKSSELGGGAAKPLGSIDDTLNEALAEINGRE